MKRILKFIGCLALAFAGASVHADVSGELAAKLAAVTPEAPLVSVTEEEWPTATPLCYGGKFYQSLKEAILAANAVNASDSAFIYCRPGATLANAGHVHLTTSITIFGNNASLDNTWEPSIEQPGGTESADSTASGYHTLTKNVQHAIYNLHDGAGLWGTRCSDYTVTLTMANCQNAHEVYATYSGTSVGQTFITVKNCTFKDGNGGRTSDWPVNLNSGGSMTVEDCSFSGGTSSITANLKQDGNQVIDVTVKNCSFTDVPGQDGKKGVIRLATEKVGTVNLVAQNLTFSGSRPNSPADITIGDAGSDKVAGTVTYDITGTAGKLRVAKKDESGAVVVGDVIDMVATQRYSDGVSAPSVQVVVEENSAKGITAVVVQEIVTNPEIEKVEQKAIAEAIKADVEGKDEAVVKVTLQEVKTEANKTTLQFVVAPYIGAVQVNNDNIKGAVPFRLPLLKEKFVEYAKISHEGDPDRFVLVKKGTNGEPYVDVALTHFSTVLASAATEDEMVPEEATLVTAGKNGFYVKGEEYFIVGKAGLKNFRDSVNGAVGGYDETKASDYSGKLFKLVADIDLEDEEWIPVGRKDPDPGIDFRGTFDGCGHEIINLKSTDADLCKTIDVLSLFGSIGKPAIVKNLTVRGEVNGSSMGAGVIGYIRDGATVENVTNYVNVTGVKRAAGLNCNAYSGEGAPAVFRNCVNYGKVTLNVASGNRMAGGISGYAADHDVIFENCRNEGEIVANGGGSGHHVGGIMGSYKNSTHTAQFKNCVNVGKLHTEISGSIVGGIVGRLGASQHGNGGEAVFENCANENTELSGPVCAEIIGSMTDLPAGGDIGFAVNGFLKVVKGKTYCANYKEIGSNKYVKAYVSDDAYDYYVASVQAAVDEAARVGGRTVTLAVDISDDIALPLGVILKQGGKKYTGTISAPSGYFASYDSVKDEWTCQLAVAQIGTKNYSSLAAAVAAAEDGDTIKVIADISDETVTVVKSVTITSCLETKPMLTNVIITESGATVELAVSNLSFAGDSYINANGAKGLFVTAVTADVTPTKILGRSAFIVLGENESTTGLDLTVADSTIIASKGDNAGGDTYATAIFGWNYMNNVAITGNTFFSAEKPTQWIIAKFMNAVKGAKFVVSGNTSYANSDAYAFDGYDYYQNNSRDNCYTVLSSNNVMLDAGTKGNESKAFTLEGNVAFSKKTNITFFDSGSTLNGRPVTLSDFCLDSYGPEASIGTYGVDIVLNESGKLTAGMFAKPPAADLLDPDFKIRANGTDPETYAVVTRPAAIVIDAAGVSNECATVAEAFAAVKAGCTVTLGKPCAETPTAPAIPFTFEKGGFAADIPAAEGFKAVASPVAGDDVVRYMPADEEPVLAAGMVKIADGFYQDSPTYKSEGLNYYITDARGLAYYRDLVNNKNGELDAYRALPCGVGAPDKTGNYRFKGHTVTLLSDVDLDNVLWTPIGYPQDDRDYMAGTFDGGNHVVSNLKVDYSGESKDYRVGFFGYACGDTTLIKNLTIDNVDVKGFRYAAGLIGCCSKSGALIDNCHLTGLVSIYCRSDWVGGIVGQGYCSVRNCSVEGDDGSNITVWGGGIRIGGIFGNDEGADSVIEGCLVSNLTISVAQNYIAGGIAGSIALGAKVSRCHVEKLTIRSERGPYLGYVVGGFGGGSGVAVISDCTVADSVLTCNRDKFMSEQPNTYYVQCGDHDSLTEWIVGSDITVDENGKVTGGVFENIPEQCIAPSYLKIDLKTVNPQTWVVTPPQVEPKTGGAEVEGLPENPSTEVKQQVAADTNNVIKTLSGDDITKFADTDVAGSSFNPDGTPKDVVKQTLVDAATEDTVRDAIAAQLGESNSNERIEIKLDKFEFAVQDQSATLSVVEYDVKPWIKVTTIVDNVEKVTEAVIPNSALAGHPLTFRLAVNSNFVNYAKVVHKDDGGNVRETYLTKVFTGATGKYVQLKSDYFSNFFLSADVTEPKCKVGDQFYNTVPDAIAANVGVPDAVFTLMAPCGDKNLALLEGQTIDLNGQAFTGSIAPVDGYHEQVTYDDKVFNAYKPQLIELSTGDKLPVRVAPAVFVTWKDGSGTFVKGDNGMEKWKNDVLGVNGSVAANKIVPMMVKAAEGSSVVTIKTPIAAFAPLAKSGVKVQYSLLKRNGGGEFVRYGESKDTPVFTVDVSAQETQTFWKIQVSYEKEY